MTRLLPLLALLGSVLAACTPPPSAPPQATATSASTGTILAIRPIAATITTAPMRSALLMNASTNAASGNNASMMEFIVRDVDGNTISIVQANDAGLSVGDRVVIQRTPSARLVRP